MIWTLLTMYALAVWYSLNMPIVTGAHLLESLQYANSNKCGPLGQTMHELKHAPTI